GGTDRFDTAVKVADWSVANAGLSYASPALATGRSPYDALAGGVVQGVDGSVLLLTESATLPAQTASALARNRAMISQVRFLGGLGAVSQAVRDSVGALLTP
ncbi:MAG: cell wall-binding repeat-containing protein, partial [Actinomycetota bacterium]|nr:cell wall-binding repeat-containing protein [Actinomycetota bacterium]